ncbi:hypothetical protein V6N11_051541 [Hibiscus sabdariffa]|uniref:Uncharacterized protein n=1 Tax=Hibiscus sabdariffa TaxID=183260 RepID=A0ABR2U7M9_9ROSI
MQSDMMGKVNYNSNLVSMGASEIVLGSCSIVESINDQDNKLDSIQEKVDIDSVEYISLLTQWGNCSRRVNQVMQKMAKRGNVQCQQIQTMKPWKLN